jgi:hypothetical protein
MASIVGNLNVSKTMKEKNFKQITCVSLKEDNYISCNYDYSNLVTYSFIQTYLRLNRVVKEIKEFLGFKKSSKRVFLDFLRVNYFNIYEEDENYKKPLIYTEDSIFTKEFYNKIKNKLKEKIKKENLIKANVNNFNLYVNFYPFESRKFSLGIDIDFKEEIEQDVKNQVYDIFKQILKDPDFYVLLFDEVKRFILNKFQLINSIIEGKSPIYKFNFSLTDLFKKNENYLIFEIYFDEKFKDIAFKKLSESDKNKKIGFKINVIPSDDLAKQFLETDDFKKSFKIMQETINGIIIIDNYKTAKMSIGIDDLKVLYNISIFNSNFPRIFYDFNKFKIC